MPVEEISMELLTPLVVQLGFGGLAGFVVGYALKKILKIVAVLIGIFILGLAYLDYVDLIDVHYDRLFEAFQKLAERLIGEGTAFTGILSTNIPAMGRFVVGLALGFKKG